MVAARMLEGRRVHPEDEFPREPGEPAGGGGRTIGAEGGLLSFLSAGRSSTNRHVIGLHRHGAGRLARARRAPDLPEELSGRSGTKDDKVYLCSPETATAAAITGVINDPGPRQSADLSPHRGPKKYIIDERSAQFRRRIEEDRGHARSEYQGIAGSSALRRDVYPPEVAPKADNTIDGYDHAQREQDPSALGRTSRRSTSFVSSAPEPGFAKECRLKGDVVVVGGENDGQDRAGSTRRWHRAFSVSGRRSSRASPQSTSRTCATSASCRSRSRTWSDYDKIVKGTRIVFPDLRKRIERGDREIPVEADEDHLDGP